MCAPVLAPDAEVSPCSIFDFPWATELVCLSRSVMIAYSAPVQVSGRCPEGGDRACRFCLSNEITSHSGPVRRKTQRDQCWTAGLRWVGALVEAASASKAVVENMLCFGEIHLRCFHISTRYHWWMQRECFQQLRQTSPRYRLQHSSKRPNCCI